MDTLVTTFNHSGVEIIIQNLSVYDLIVDKVEFIPIDILIENEGDVSRCEGVQSLETEKEIVNSLFIN